MAFLHPTTGGVIYPREVGITLQKVQNGGVFHYHRDGRVFHNKEQLLPAKPYGFYREYTVDTPGALDRGERRIVCGGPRWKPTVFYYTDDHYHSFQQIICWILDQSADTA